MASRGHGGASPPFTPRRRNYALDLNPNPAFGADALTGHDPGAGKQNTLIAPEVGGGFGSKLTFTRKKLLSAILPCGSRTRQSGSNPDARTPRLQSMAAIQIGEYEVAVKKAAHCWE